MRWTCRTPRCWRSPLWRCRRGTACCLWLGVEHCKLDGWALGGAGAVSIAWLVSLCSIRRPSIPSRTMYSWIGPKKNAVSQSRVWPPAREKKSDAKRTEEDLHRRFFRKRRARSGETTHCADRRGSVRTTAMKGDAVTGLQQSEPSRTITHHAN
jgi:hypothetical protein